MSGEIDILRVSHRHLTVRTLLLSVLVISTAAKIFAASSDYERYGSMAWSNARSNERASDYNSRYSANANTNVTFSAAEIAAMTRGFENLRPARNTNYSQQSSNTYAVAPRPPAPTEEETNLANAKAGNVKAMKWLGDYYLSRGTINTIALGWYEAAAQAGDSSSMYRAFAMQMDDYYHTKNVTRGMQWLKQLADRGDDPEWITRYAQHLWTGDGVPPNKTLAFQYRLKAASHPKGAATDRVLVAESYAAGEGVEKNFTQAIEWYRRAVELPEAACPLARLLVEHGGGAAKNQAELEKLFTTIPLIYPETSFYYGYLKDSGELPPRNVRVALDRYAYVLDFQPNDKIPAEVINPLRISSAKRIFEINLHGDGVPADRAAARKVGLLGLKVGETTFRPVELGFLLIDPALGEPEKEWAIKCFDAHPDDLDALRECAHLTKDPGRMAKLVDRGDGDAARFLADYERFFAARFDREAKPGFYRERSRAWAKKGAALANLDCLTRLGFWLIEDSRLTIPPDRAAAMQAEGLVSLKQAAESQHPLGMAKFGESYRDGVSVEKNPTEAFRWFKKSADAGSSLGKYDLAMALYEGAGATVDKPSALKLAEEAATEIPDAAHFYGICLWRGDCGQQDIAAGIKWMESALKKEFWPAGLTLAKIYHLGSGVPKDEKRAHDYLIEATETENEVAQRAVAEAFEKGEIIDRDERESDTRFDNLGRALGGKARNGGFVAAHYLREGNKNRATWWVLYGGDEADPEIIRVKAELENERSAMLAAEIPAARATLDENLELLENAAANFSPTAERPSFFTYGVNFGSSRRSRDDDYERISIMPESPERDLVLGARDAIMAGAGDFEAAIIAQQQYYGGDSLRGPRFLKAVQTIAIADAKRGDVDAMNLLARLSCPMFSEEFFPGWQQDDREALRWCHRALLAGNRGAVEWIDHFYADPASVPKANAQQRQRWKKLRDELGKINDDDPNATTLIAACARKFPAL